MRNRASSRCCAGRPGTGAPPPGWPDPRPVPPRRRSSRRSLAPHDPLRAIARRGAVRALAAPTGWGRTSSGATSFPGSLHGARLSLAVGIGNGRHLAPHRPGRRVAGRLPRRRRRPGLHRRLRRPAGVPRDPARHRDRRRARPLVRQRAVRAFGPRVGGVRPGDPRAGALREDEGVRRIGPRRGRLPGAPAPAPHPPQRDLPDPRGGDLRDRARHRRRGGALLPGAGRRAAGGRRGGR